MGLWEESTIHYEEGVGGTHAVSASGPDPPPAGGRGAAQRRWGRSRTAGDGTVEYSSLSLCHSWFLGEAVNATRVPQVPRALLAGLPRH